MKLNRTYGLLVGALIISVPIVIGIGCHSGAVPSNGIPGGTKPPAPQPVPNQSGPVAPEAQKNPGNSGAEASKTPMPADAQGFLKQAVENSLNTKSFSSEITINVEVEGMTWPVILGVDKSDNISYISSEFMGMRFEAYSDGKSMVMMDPMTKRWARMPPEQKDMVLSMLELVQNKIYGEHLQNVAFGGEEKMEDKACRVIEASLNPGAASKILDSRNNPMMQGLDVKFDKTALKIWIEKDAGLIHRAVLNMEATLTGDIPGMPGSDIEDEDEAGSKPPSAKPDEHRSDRDSEHRSDRDSEHRSDRDSEPKTTKIKYEIEVNNSDYNKVAPITVPPEAKSLLEQPLAPVNAGPANK